MSGVRGWGLGIGEQVSGDRGQGLGVRVWGLPELQPPGGVRIQDSRFNSRFKSRFDWIIGAPASGRSPEPRFTIQDSRWRIQNGEERGRALLGPTSGVRATLPLWRFQFPVSSFEFRLYRGVHATLLLWPGHTAILVVEHLMDIRSIEVEHRKPVEHTLGNVRVLGKSMLIP